MSETIIKMTGGVIRQQKNTILKDVNIEIQSGEFVYLIGKVGSGKSSFLKTLYAELPLEYGKAEVAGFQLNKLKKSQTPLLRRKCGIVFQDFKLLIDRNVYENLEFVLCATGWKNKQAIRERIDTVLEKVGMLDKKQQMPHQLSGGEQQRIVLARALLNAPPLILADEPTGNIDPETSYRLVELLKEICETGKTVVIATHQYDLIERYPGRVFCCENGTLFERKTTIEPETKIIFGTTEEPLTDEVIREGLPAVEPENETTEQTAAQEIREEEIPQPEANATTVEPTEENTNEPEQTPAEPLQTEQETEIETPQPEIVNNEEPQPEPTPVVDEPAKTAPEQPVEDDDIMKLIGRLNYPVITSFDYELEQLPEINPEEEKTEEKQPEPQPTEPLPVIETEQPPVKPKATKGRKKTQEVEEEEKKETPPFMDLELID